MTTPIRTQEGDDMSETSQGNGVDGVEASAVLYKIMDHVAYVTINRPERRNAIGVAVRKGLIEAFCDAAVDDDVWAVVLTGAGDKAFCAGGEDRKSTRLNSSH